MYLFKFLFLISGGIKPGVELLVHVAVLLLVFGGNCIMFSVWLYQFTFSLTVDKDSLFFSSSLVFVISLSLSFFFHNKHNREVEEMSHCGFDFHFLGD